MSDSDNQSTKSNERGWRPGHYQSQVREAGLYIVATPIGNLGDISIRALDTLAAVDVILCEDTRVSGKLLSYYGIDGRLEAYHDHSDAAKRSSIVKRIHEGVKFALISDAGMPMISDPGYKLICDLNEAGCYVTTIAGANAPLAALQLSGMPSDAFSFIGFLPHKKGARQAHLNAWALAPGSLIAFESATRLKASLGDIDKGLSGRKVAVVREISKKFEEVRSGFPAEIIAHYDAEGMPKGEIVLVIEPPVSQKVSEGDIRAMLIDALKTMSTKEAASEISKVVGLPRKHLYELALTISKDAK